MHQVGRMSGISRNTVRPSSETRAAAIRDGLRAAAELAERLASAPQVAEIADAALALQRPDPAVAAELAAALADDLPHVKRDGGCVGAHYHAPLDEARALRDESRRVIAGLQARYAEETGVRSLKIRHNNVLGYFVETTAQNGEKFLRPPLNATFIHRQTLAGQVRFTTTELGALILLAAGGLLIAEKILFPGRYGRLENLALHGRQAAQIAVGAVLMLFVAAILEGGFRQLVASTPWRFAIGLGIGGLWITYFSLWGRSKRV